MSKQTYGLSVAPSRADAENWARTTATRDLGRPDVEGARCARLVEIIDDLRAQLAGTDVGRIDFADRTRTAIVAEIERIDTAAGTDYIAAAPTIRRGLRQQAAGARAALAAYDLAAMSPARAATDV